MKKIKQWLNDIFAPEQDLDIHAIGSALNDPTIRAAWMQAVLDEIRAIHVEIDRRLLNGEMNLIDLCARRKAFKDVLEAILSARRTVTREARHNPMSEMPVVDLDRVTV